MSHPLASALRAQAAALVATADALDAGAIAPTVQDGDPVRPLADWAAELGTSPRAMRDAAIRGELRARRAGGKSRGPMVATRSDVLAWLDARPVATAKPSRGADAEYLALVGGSR